MQKIILIHHAHSPEGTICVSVGVGETIGEEELAGWQPISATSLQQLS